MPAAEHFHQKRIGLDVHGENDQTAAMAEGPFHCAHSVVELFLWGEKRQPNHDIDLCQKAKALDQCHSALISRQIDFFHDNMGLVNRICGFQPHFYRNAFVWKQMLNLAQLFRRDVFVMGLNFNPLYLRLCGPFQHGLK